MAELASARRDGGPDESVLPPRRSGARRWWLLLVVLAAAIAVVTDLTTHASPGYHRAQLRAYISGAFGDVAQCQAGLRDAVSAYTGWTTGAPDRTRSLATTFAGQAIAVCGFANENVVNLVSDQPARSIASPAVDKLAGQVGTWAYLDAFTFLQDLRSLIAHPASASARGKAEAELAALAAQRARVEALVEKVERAGGIPARPVQLVQLSSLLPGGALPPAKEASR